MTLRRRRVLIAIAVAGAMIVGIGIGARGLLPPWLRGALEGAASRALGREVEIAGPFDLSLFPTPRLEAGGVTLANAPWGSEPSMARVGRVRLVPDLWSLVSGPVRVVELEVEDARLLLEADTGGCGNWVLPPRPPSSRPRDPSGRAPVTFDRVAVRGFELVYRPHPDATPVILGVRALEARLEPATSMVRVRGDGHFNQAPWDISGLLGPLERIVESRDVLCALAGRVGESNAAVRGRLGDPLMLGSPDLEVSAEGPDIAAALGQFGLRSPLAGPFRLHGRLESGRDRVDVDLEVAIGDVTAAVRGSVGALLALDRVEASVKAAGPDASVVGSWIGVRGLPLRGFDLAGRVRLEDGRLTVDDARVRAGSTAVVVAGDLGMPPRFVGTDLAVQAGGQDLSELSHLTRLGLPPGPFEVEGRFLRSADGLFLEAAELRAGDTVVRVDGTTGEPPRLSNLDLTVDASGPDLAWLSSVFTANLPEGPFAIRGRVARDGPAFSLDTVEGRLGDTTVSVDGRLMPARRLEGTDVRVRVAGPDLADFADRAELHGAPAEPFEAEGHVLVVPGGYLLHGVEATVGGVQAAVDGRVGAPSALSETWLSGRVHGPELSDLAAWGLPGTLPADPFSVSGRLRVDERVFHADQVVAIVGADRARVDGVLGARPELDGLDVGVDASGPSLARLERFFEAGASEVLGWLPADAYAISGRVRRVPSGYELHEVRAQAGGTAVRVDGTIGAGGSLRGTDLRVDASGSDLAATLGPVVGSSILPGDAFEISSTFVLDDERRASARFTARLGGSDLEGRLAASLDGRPFVDVDLRSRRLDLGGLLAGSGAAPAAGSAPVSVSATTGGATQHLIPDDPLRLDVLRAVDGALRLEAAEVLISGHAIRDVVVAGGLRGGALGFDRVEGSGLMGGRVSASLVLQPSGEGYRVRARGRLDGARLALRGTGAPPDNPPSVDVELDFEGEGRSPHEIAASGEGRALVILGSGQIPSALGDRLGSPVLRGLLDALNPFRSSSERTEVECAVASVQVEGGRALVEPIAARTDTITVMGHGAVDLGSEAVDFVWTIKPRKGVGISASSLANPYIRLSGTLASPKLEVKPLQAAASTGAALASGGMTILLKGLYDRLTAEKKVCVDALAEVAEQGEARKAAGGEQRR